MLAQIALEAASGKQSGVVAISGNEHERAGLAVGRARGVYQDAHGDSVACGALAIEQRKKRTE